MRAIHCAAIGITKLAAHQLQALMPKQEVGNGHDQAAAGIQTAPQLDEEFFGTVKMFEHMAAENAIKLAKTGDVKAIEILYFHPIESLPRDDGFRFIEGHADDRTAKFRLEQPSHAPAATTDVEQGLGVRRDLCDHWLIDRIITHCDSPPMRIFLNPNADRERSKKCER